MKDIFDLIIKIAGLAGIIGFIWKLIEERSTFLLIKVEAKNIDSEATVFTQVQNLNKFNRKKINNAFLIISPEDYNLGVAALEIAEKFDIPIEIKSTNDFGNLYSEKYKPIYINKKIAFIPLPFYYIENIDVADEQLTYRCHVDKKYLNKGPYSVRFFLYGEDRFLHRSTQDLMIIN